MNTSKDLRSLTKLERERELKKLRGETEELIDEMGQASDEKAKRSVKEFVQKQEEERQQLQEIDEEQLKLLSNNKQKYQRYLLVVVHRFIQEEAIPKNYQIWAESNDQGIAIGIENTSFVGAFRVCGIPFYDINACKVLAVQLGNTVAKLEGHHNASEGGILLPDSLDKKTYG